MKISYNRLKLFIGNRVLERLLKKKSTRVMRSCNLDDAKSLGILCVIRSKEDYESVLKIIDIIKMLYKYNKYRFFWE